MRARVRYAKLGRLRFVSAIDLGRVWERALRRARLPIAYSEGFHAHPKVSFPDALPLGYASLAEYAELRFTERVDLPEAMARLNASLPEGMDVRSALEVPDGAPRLAKWLRASVWDLAYPVTAAAALPLAARAVTEAGEVLVERLRKEEATTLDLRPAVHHLSTTDAGHGVPTPTVRATLHHVEPPMRPSEVHQALDDAARRVAGVALPAPTVTTRVAQGEPTEEGLREALDGTLVPSHPENPEEATYRDRHPAARRDPGLHDPGLHDGGVHDGGARARGAHDRGAHDGGPHDGGAHDGGSYDHRGVPHPGAHPYPHASR